MQPPAAGIVPQGQQKQKIALLTAASVAAVLVETVKARLPTENRQGQARGRR